MAGGVTSRWGNWSLMGPWLWTAGDLTRTPYHWGGCGGGDGAEGWGAAVFPATRRLDLSLATDRDVDAGAPRIDGTNLVEIWITSKLAEEL